MSDYPTCETCDYCPEDWKRGIEPCDMGVLVGSDEVHGIPFEMPDEFGCILHSDLEDDAKEYDAEDVTTRAPNQQDTYTV